MGPASVYADDVEGQGNDSQLFSNDILWQTSTIMEDVYKPSRGSAGAVTSSDTGQTMMEDIPASVLSSDEPTLPNIARKRPVDPDLDYLFDPPPSHTPPTGAKHPSNISPMRMAAAAGVSQQQRPGGSPRRSPVHDSPRSPMPLILSPSSVQSSLAAFPPAVRPSASARSNIVRAAQAAEFTDVSLADNLDQPGTSSAGHGSDGAMAARDGEDIAPPSRDLSLQTFASSVSSSDSLPRPSAGPSTSLPPSSPSSPPPPPPNSGKMDGDHQDPVAWADLTLYRKWELISTLLILASEGADLLLGFVYLATYNFACYALVTSYAGSLNMAFVMFYLALMATSSSGLFFYLSLTRLSRARKMFPANDSIRAILWLADAQTESWSNGDINHAKLVGLAQFTLRDSVAMFVMLGNLGPRDANGLTLVRLVLLSVSLARMGSHLFLAFAVRAFLDHHHHRHHQQQRLNPKRREIHQTLSFAACRYFLALVVMCIWLVVPLAFFAAPEELARYVYATTSTTKSARMIVLCAPELGCDPAQCRRVRTEIHNYPVHNSTTGAAATISSASVCAIVPATVALPAGTNRDRIFSLQVPGVAGTLSYSALLPCQPPMSSIGTRRTSSSAWSKQLAIPGIRPRAPRYTTAYTTDPPPTGSGMPGGKQQLVQVPVAGHGAADDHMYPALGAGGSRNCGLHFYGGG
ncbi:hypothetical protein BC828DRAFT_436777 [Blastocladiella britannica]|nr:hypothetical protein BC828DRAFT_436777 [Blastocladiella britannica]